MSKGKNLVKNIFVVVFIGIMGFICYKMFFAGSVVQTAKTVYSPISVRAFRIQDMFLDDRLNQREIERLKYVETKIPKYFKMRRKCLEEGRWRFYGPEPRSPKIPPFMRSAAYPGTQPAVADGTVLLFVCIQSLIKQT